MAQFFIRRPIVAMVISILMVLVGYVALSGLPVAQYPNIVPPMIQVTTTYNGASAVDVEQGVATPVEQKVNGVANAIYMKSTNAGDGTYNLQVSFEVGSDLDMSNVLVQNRQSWAFASLPTSVQQYGVQVQASLSFPMILVTLTSPKNTYDNDFLSNYASINVNNELARINGIGMVNLFGGSDYAMRIWVNPDRLKGFGLTVADLAILVVLFAYYFISEALLGKTVGKFLTGTRVVAESGGPAQVWQIFVRTLCRFVPFDVFSFLGRRGYGWHDRWSKTRVVAIRDR